MVYGLFWRTLQDPTTTPYTMPISVIRCTVLWTNLSAEYFVTQRYIVQPNLKNMSNYLTFLQEWPGARAVATEVKESILRHLWYMTEECVAFTLFDEELPDSTRQQIAREISRTPRPQQFPPGKPVFPKYRVEQATHGELTLDSLVGPNSWLLFELLQTDGAWLGLPPRQWSANQDYAAASSIIHHLQVVNDGAERAIKDIQEYSDSARDGGHRGDIVLVSSSHRIKLKSFLKNEMENVL